MLTEIGGLFGTSIGLYIGFYYLSLNKSAFGAILFLVILFIFTGIFFMIGACLDSYIFRKRLRR